MASVIRCNALAQLAEPGNSFVRFDSLRETHEFIVRGLMFEHFDTQPYGPPQGLQLHYVRDDVQIRIKTHGDAGGPRQGQAHLSAALWEGTLKHKGELAKFTLSGVAMVDPSPRRQRELFGELPLSRPSNWQLARELWANATHLNFRSRTLEGGEYLRVGHDCDG